MSDSLPPLPGPINAKSVGFGQLYRPLFNDDQMRTYAAAAVAAERERCAKLCESLAVFVHPIASQGNQHSMQYMGAQLTEVEHYMALACARRIRAIGA